jgi:hypothetical protein
MKKKMRIWVSVAVFSLLPLSLAVASSAEPEYTVGEFAVDLAKMITNKADFSAAEAAGYLEQVGVELPGTLDSTVSEEELVDVLNQVGVHVSTSNPERTVAADTAGRLFQMFDSNDALFAGELFKTCQTGDGEPHQCITDSDCAPGHPCTVVQSIKCHSGPNDGLPCMTPGDCPMGVCNIPPGQQRKLDPASPDD